MTASSAAPFSTDASVPLSRANLAARAGLVVPLAPVRMVHLGLGAFARAHQAWYTEVVDERNEWGIAAFTGRSARAATALSQQDGLYSLIERSSDGDRVGVVGSISEAWDGARLDRLVPLLAAQSTALVTLTITEPGYRLLPDGTPDMEDQEVTSDVARLRAATSQEAGAPDGLPRTALGRILLGLDARRRALSGPIAIVPCDNIPDNGPFVRSGLLALADLVHPDLAPWTEANVSFVSTSVDRITPKTTPDDVETVSSMTGFADADPVVTEPFHDWVLSGDFPAGRPAWERAGARFVQEIEPFERRKLWLLNGAHSHLAYSGLLRGHETVAAAIADPACRREVLELWSEAARHLPADLQAEEYTAALLTRFANARIEHRLRQVAAQGVTKLRVRVVPVALAERSSGRPAQACANAIAAWATMAQRQPLEDASRNAVEGAIAAPDTVAALVAVLDERLAADGEFMRTVRIGVDRFSRMPA